MSDVHIFIASGESCPICAALDGLEVEPGFHAHDGCLCQTVVKDDSTACAWNFQQIGNARSGMGEFDVITGFQVTVTCPDGSASGATGSFDGHVYSQLPDQAQAYWDWVQGLHTAAEILAQSLCDGCVSGEPFLCC